MNYECEFAHIKMNQSKVIKTVNKYFPQENSTLFLFDSENNEQDHSKTRCVATLLGTPARKGVFFAILFTDLCYNFLHTPISI